MADEHEFDLLTAYCIHCGQNLLDTVEYNLLCHRIDNITAISHRVRQHGREIYDTILPSSNH
jgi:hypothetical protein